MILYLGLCKPDVRILQTDGTIRWKAPGKEAHEEGDIFYTNTTKLVIWYSVKDWLLCNHIRRTL